MQRQIGDKTAGTGGKGLLALEDGVPPTQSGSRRETQVLRKQNNKEARLARNST